MHNTFWISSYFLPFYNCFFLYLSKINIPDVQEVYSIFAISLILNALNVNIIIMIFEFYYYLILIIIGRWRLKWRGFFGNGKIPNDKIMKLNVHGNKLPSSLGNKLDGQIRCPSADRRRCLCSRAILLILRNFREIFTLRSDASLVIE